MNDWLDAHHKERMEDPEYRKAVERLERCRLWYDFLAWVDWYWEVILIKCDDLWIALKTKLGINEPS